jgi:uncharacterized membrane protein YuzA (DUF378 family)
MKFEQLLSVVGALNIGGLSIESFEVVKLFN